MPRAMRVGHIDLSFHDASAREVERVLAKHGHQIERSAAPHEEMFRRIGRGEVDVLVSAWLPTNHGLYLAPIKEQVRAVTVLYEPYNIWGVPDFVPETEVGEISDLLHAPVLARMEKLIQGINPGAGISRSSAEIVKHYSLAEAGYYFRTGMETECFDRFELAVAERRWVIVPLWHPQYLHHRYRIRALREPKGLLGGVDKATLIVRRDAEALLGRDALEELGSLHLGNNRVSALDDALRSGSKAGKDTPCHAE